MRPNFVLVCCCLVLLSSPSLADEAKREAEGPVTAMMAPASCPTVTIGTPEPLFLTGCSVQVVCADNTTVSCSGNATCSTGGTNNRCVFCDGASQGCCPITCCEQCETNLDNCLNGCGLPSGCGVCGRVYNRCVTGCGGCP